MAILIPKAEFRLDENISVSLFINKRLKQYIIWY